MIHRFGRLIRFAVIGSLALPCTLAAQRAGRGIPPDANNGFVEIFDGKSLNNWDGDPVFWRVENGVIVAESTPEKRVGMNTFLIWRGGTTRDFELKIEYRVTPTANSGVQYRSTVVSSVGRWAMKGYQADLDGANVYSGQIYEERGRGFIARRGSFVRFNATSAGGSTLIGSFGDDTTLKALLKPNDWNSLHIIARGNTIIQLVNGRVMSAVVDEDEGGRAMEGLLGLQLHTGEPMRIEFRSLWFKKL
jgi:3-keto-disaccharide hydrolase